MTGPLDDYDTRSRAVAIITAAVDGGQDVLRDALRDTDPILRNDPTFQALLAISAAIVRFVEANSDLPIRHLVANWATQQARGAPPP